MRAVIITASGFQDEEFVYPFYRLQEEGFTVDVATQYKGDAIGKYGIPARATMFTDALCSADYDVVIIPGGTEGPDRVRQDSAVIRFLKFMHDEGKTIAAICHGPWVLISAGVLRGKRATCYVGMRDDLVNAGATYVDAPVVVDGNLVIAPHYRNNGDLMKAVFENVRARAPAETPGEIDFSKVIVRKPWGSEYLVYRNEKVAIWSLHIKEGEQTSLHCHPNKKTGIILLRGEAEVSFLNDSHRMSPLSKTMIRQGLFHSTKAISPGGVEIIETETPDDKMDLVRLTDHYGREGKPYEGITEMQLSGEDCPRLMHHESNLIGGCVLFIRKFNDRCGFQNANYCADDIIVVLEGGLVSRLGVPVVGPGDIIGSNNLDHLNAMCEAPAGAIILVVRKEYKI